MSTAAKTHSYLGIVGCLLAFAVWVYLVAVIYVFFYVEGFTDKFNSFIAPPSNRIADFRGFGTAILIMIMVFFLIPAAGHLLGIIVSFVGLIRANKKRLFSILGLFLNILPMLILLILFVIGGLSSPK